MDPIPANATPLNAFTVDVEDYFQVSAFATQVPTSTWDDFQCRVEPNTERILRLLDRHQVRGTFFVLGWVAQRYPQLVRRIAAAGHTIGSHSYWHRLIYDLTPEEFATDLRQSLDAIEGVTGQKVRSFRAPSFSVVTRSLWALEILAAAGIELDSSIYPIHHDRYGIPGAQIPPYQVNTPSGNLWEFPPTVWQLPGYNLPVGGGGYLRIFPSQLTHFALGRIRRSGRPFQIYIHPWEVDPDQPRMRVPLKTRFRHYTNLRKTEHRLEQLLSRFPFATLESSLESEIDRRARDPVRAAAVSTVHVNGRS